MSMKPFRKWLAIIALCVFLSQFACKNGGTEPAFEQPVLLGFQDKFALRLVLSEPYLYVCAGSDGVWRRNIRQSTQQWEYLGLRDTTLGRYTNVGALDIDVLGEDILVAYNGSAPHVVPESTVSIWRSRNAGTNWFRSDSGIPETIDFTLEANILTSLQRSPHQPHVIIGDMEAASYRSMDSGFHWSLLWGRRGIIAGTGHVRWHPFRAGEVWFFGTTGLFSPYCGAVQDYGVTPKGGVNFDSLGFPSDGAVDDVAFDAGNPNIVYAATSYGVIKTTDGGYAWRRNAVMLPDNGFVFRMIHHPSITSVLYLAGGRRVYSTRNAGIAVQVLAEIDRGFITSLLLDSQANQLFLGTTEGGIYALKLIGR
ncbi:MAG: hypothetical protein AAB393_01840 [Bacteroidota bacterium]|mgnify:CR=1 FL=1